MVFMLVSSGCLIPGGGGGDTKSIGSDAIELVELTVQPRNIVEGSRSTVILRIRNSGHLDTEVEINSENNGGLETDPYGDRILTDRCSSLFKVDDFNVRGPRESEYATNTGYELPSGSELAFTWVLESNSDNIVPGGSDCELDFQVPFDYSVNAYRDIQIVKSREVEGTSELNSESSTGPMLLRIDTFGSTSDRANTFLDGNSAQASVKLINQGREGSDFTGFIETSKPDVTSNKYDLDCENPSNFRIFNGESRSIRCDIKYDLNGTPSISGEIRASADYTYVQDLGTEEITVKPLGN
jgi:hypothetical protein